MTAFVPPTPPGLRAMAGWALSVNHSTSPAQSCALEKFKDGCVELADNYPNIVCSVIPQVARTREAVPPVSPSPRLLSSPQDMAEVVERANTPCGNNHKFNIRTQRCIWCKRTYREIKGARPVFMGNDQ